MQKLNLFGLCLAMSFAKDLEEIEERLQSPVAELQEEVAKVVMAFISQPTSPQGTLTFEKDLQEILREAGRQITEMVYNRLEPENPEDLPKRFTYQNQEYSRKEEKTPNRGGIGTVFGTITLHRYSCEPLQEARDDGQKSFSPLELQLGIVAGNATPALAERVGELAAGHTQQEVLERLKQDHGVKWSVDVLRKVTAAVSEGVAEHLHASQKAQVLDWLGQADASQGRRAIVLAVGRDGIMLPIRGEKSYKEGAVATITVYDRRGQRLGTIYLGQMPEAHQTTLSKELTRLLREVLGEWKGCWPRLVYITDAGHHPTEYFETVLKSLEDPRHPGRLLKWTRVVDFYHASEYLAKLANVLFDDTRAARAWLKRMRHWLKHDRRAVFRILHSAAKHHSERVLSKAEEGEYQKAYQYLNSHKEWMDYRAYSRQGFPIGSGVTEAACKTVFTQRFKESGMTWKLAGGRTILVLRLAKLSGVWDSVYQAFLQTLPMAQPITKPASVITSYAEAA
jgi:hypothetical protein